MKSRQGDARQSGSVRMREYFGETLLCQQLRDIPGLVAAVLETQSTLLAKMRRRSGDDRTKGLEARRAGRQGKQRLSVQRP
jgi:hypothetical protein